MLYRETDMNERSIGAADYQDLPRPIAAMAKNFASGSRTPPHRHKRAQLVFAAHGTMVVWTAQGSWVVPPNRAVWMPAGTEHAIRMNGRVAMRTLYVRADLAAAMPAKCCVIAVSPLMRELILRAVELPLLYDEAGAAGRVMALILDEMRVLPVLPLHLPWPEDMRLKRLFRRETGMSFGAWRQQVRLVDALGRLANGQPVADVALDLGYQSPSAFT